MISTKMEIGDALLYDNWLGLETLTRLKETFDSQGIHISIIGSLIDHKNDFRISSALVRLARVGFIRIDDNNQLNITEEGMQALTNLAKNTGVKL